MYAQAIWVYVEGKQVVLDFEFVALVNRLAARAQMPPEKIVEAALLYYSIATNTPGVA